MKWNRNRRRLAIICCAALVAIGIAEIYVANSLVAPANHTVGTPPPDLPVVATTVTSDSGSDLATWYIPADNAHATIILLHAIRGDRRSMLGRAKLFHDAGYSIVMIDFQAHGESPGDHITVGFLERYDVRAAVDYARTKNPHHRIGIVGCSLGGAATLLASPLNVDAVVLESVYPTFDEAVHNRVSMRLGPLSDVLSPVLLWQFQLRLGISPSDLRPIDHIADIGCPVLVVGGELDQHTTLAETQRLFDSAQEPKKLVIFQRAAHTDFLAQNPKQYEAEVLPFLATYLAPIPEPPPRGGQAHFAPKTPQNEPVPDEPVPDGSGIGAKPPAVGLWDRGHLEWQSCKSFGNCRVLSRGDGRSYSSGGEAHRPLEMERGPLSQARWALL